MLSFILMMSLCFTALEATQGPFLDMEWVLTDAEGPNDVFGQDDLTGMAFGQNSSHVWLAWSWDDISFGSRTGDACGLFDSDRDGMVDYAVCASVESVEAGITTLKPGSPYVKACDGASSDRCTGDLPVFANAPAVSSCFMEASSSACPNLVSNAGPFIPAGGFHGLDSILQLVLPKATLPASSVLINTCSFASAAEGGNGSPIDCLAPPRAGFVQVNLHSDWVGSVVLSLSNVVDPALSSFMASLGSATVRMPLLSLQTADAGNGAVQTTALSLASADTELGFSGACFLEDGTRTGKWSGSTLSQVLVQASRITTCNLSVVEGQSSISGVLDWVPLRRQGMLLWLVLGTCAAAVVFACYLKRHRATKKQKNQGRAVELIVPAADAAVSARAGNSSSDLVLEPSINPDEAEESVIGDDSGLVSGPLSDHGSLGPRSPGQLRSAVASPRSSQKRISGPLSPATLVRAVLPPQNSAMGSLSVLLRAAAADNSISDEIDEVNVA